MSESNTRAEIVEVMARAQYDNWRDYFQDGPSNPLPTWTNLDHDEREVWRKRASAALTALESSGRAVVPRRALEQIINLSDCGFAVDVAEEALAAALPPRSE
jgi:hypothetical protein